MAAADAFANIKWLSHASFLVEFPGRNTRILFNPALPVFWPGAYIVVVISPVSAILLSSIPCSPFLAKYALNPCSSCKTTRAAYLCSRGQRQVHQRGNPGHIRQRIHLVGGTPDAWGYPWRPPHQLVPWPSISSVRAIPSGKDSLVKGYSTGDAVYRSANVGEDGDEERPLSRRWKRLGSVWQFRSGGGYVQCSFATCASLTHSFQCPWAEVGDVRYTSFAIGWCLYPQALAEQGCYYTLVVSCISFLPLLSLFSSRIWILTRRLWSRWRM